MKLTAPSLRQCVECGQVYLAGAPSAERIPRTCPHECGAAVREVKTLTELVE